MFIQALFFKGPYRTVAIAAFFLPLALIPWLNPVSGGAITPAIPLLVGWTCSALLFAGLPAKYLSRQAIWSLAVLVLATALSLVLGLSWQLLAAGLLMLCVASLVGVRLVQEFAPFQASNTFKRTGTDPAQTGVALIAWSWFLAGLLNAFIGFLQYRQQTAWLGELVNYAAPGQVYGNLRQRNQFATLMSMALWSLWYLWQQGHLQRVVRYFSKDSRVAAIVLAGVCMLPLSAGMALTLSRTGLLQLSAMAGMLLFWILRNSKQTLASCAEEVYWLIGMVLVYMATAYLLPYLNGEVDMLVRLEGKDSRACISRTVLWRNVLDLIVQKPWLGWGWGELDYAHYYGNFPGMRFCSMVDNAHNLPLHLAVELGLPIAVLICCAFLGWVVSNRPWAETNPSRQLMWGVLTMIVLHSLLEYPLWYSHFQLAFGLALGVLGATRCGQPMQMQVSVWSSVTKQGAQIRRTQRVLAALVLVGLAYAGFDFVRVTQLYLYPKDRVWPFRVDPEKQAERSFLYRDAVMFARITTDEVTPEQAQEQLKQARQLMHYSPEPRVIIRVIDSLQTLGRQTEAEIEIDHFRQVYPNDYARWFKGEEAD